MLQSAPRAERTTHARDVDLLDRGALELARLVRAREVSAAELVEACIRRTSRVNPAINAVVSERFERAMDEARAVDRARPGAPDERPLLGVPCTIKEFVAVEGMPHSGGLVTRRDVVAQRDAPLVTRLRAAGAIVLGTTNVPEGGLWMETVNKVYGRTNNPWDVTRTPGGSSGGEGAIVAAGGVPFGLGSDIGGSIRIPAAFCGTVGHKPTGGLTPNTGMFPPVPPAASAFNCHGPLARKVADLMPLLRIMAGPDEGDPACRAIPLGDPSAVDLREVVVFPIEDSGRTRVRPVMRRAVRDAARALEDRGASVREARLPALARGLGIWAAMLQEASEGATYEEVLASGSGKGAIDPWRETLKWLIGRSHHTLPALGACLLGRVASKLPSAAARFAEEGRAFRAELEALLGDRGVLVYPPYTRPAPKHGEPLLTPLDVVHTAVFNPIGVPVTVVPIGFDARGLPVAVQIVAAPGRDHLSIAVAAALEEAFGGAAIATPEGV